MTPPKFNTGDQVWIREWMSNTPGHEGSSDRGYRMFIRPVEVDRVTIVEGIPSLFYYSLSDSGESLGYWKYWNDQNVFKTQEEAIETNVH